jgi:hypothetical protein
MPAADFVAEIEGKKLKAVQDRLKKEKATQKFTPDAKAPSVWWTSMHVAACTGDGPILTALLAAGGDVGVPDHEDNTPLHWAARSDTGAKAAELLLVKKAKLDALNKVPRRSCACGATAVKQTCCMRCSVLPRSARADSQRRADFCSPTGEADAPARRCGVWRNRCHGGLAQGKEPLYAPGPCFSWPAPTDAAAIHTARCQRHLLQSRTRLHTGRVTTRRRSAGREQHAAAGCCPGLLRWRTQAVTAARCAGPASSCGRQPRAAGRPKQLLRM